MPASGASSSESFSALVERFELRKISEVLRALHYITSACTDAYVQLSSSSTVRASGSVHSPFYRTSGFGSSNDTINSGSVDHLVNPAVLADNYRPNQTPNSLIPSEFLDGVTSEIMVHPVRNSDGEVLDRRSAVAISHRIFEVMLEAAEGDGPEAVAAFKKSKHAASLKNPSLVSLDRQAAKIQKWLEMVRKEPAAAQLLENCTNEVQLEEKGAGAGSSSNNKSPAKGGPMFLVNSISEGVAVVHQLLAVAIREGRIAPLFLDAPIVQYARQYDPYLYRQEEQQEYQDMSASDNYFNSPSGQATNANTIAWLGSPSAMASMGMVSPNRGGMEGSPEQNPAIQEALEARQRAKDYGLQQRHRAGPMPENLPEATVPLAPNLGIKPEAGEIKSLVKAQQEKERLQELEQMRLAAKLGGYRLLTDKEKELLHMQHKKDLIVLQQQERDLRKQFWVDFLRGLYQMERLAVDEEQTQIEKFLKHAGESNGSGQEDGFYTAPQLSVTKAEGTKKGMRLETQSGKRVSIIAASDISGLMSGSQVLDDLNESPQIGAVDSSPFGSDGKGSPKDTGEPEKPSSSSSTSVVERKVVVSPASYAAETIVIVEPSAAQVKANRERAHQAGAGAPLPGGTSFADRRVSVASSASAILPFHFTTAPATLKERGLLLTEDESEAVGGRKDTFGVYSSSREEETYAASPGSQSNEGRQRQQEQVLQEQIRVSDGSFSPSLFQQHQQQTSSPPFGSSGTNNLSSGSQVGRGGAGLSQDHQKLFASLEHRRSSMQVLAEELATTTDRLSAQQQSLQQSQQSAADLEQTSLPSGLHSQQQSAAIFNRSNDYDHEGSGADDGDELDAALKQLEREEGEMIAEAQQQRRASLQSSQAGGSVMSAGLFQFQQLQQQQRRASIGLSEVLSEISGSASPASARFQSRQGGRIQSPPKEGLKKAPPLGSALATSPAPSESGSLAGGRGSKQLQQSAVLSEKEKGSGGKGTAPTSPASAPRRASIASTPTTASVPHAGTSQVAISPTLFTPPLLPHEQQQRQQPAVGLNGSQQSNSSATPSSAPHSPPSQNNNAACSTKWGSAAVEEKREEKTIVPIEHPLQRQGTAGKPDTTTESVSLASLSATSPPMESTAAAISRPRQRSYTSAPITAAETTLPPALQVQHPRTEETPLNDPELPHGPPWRSGPSSSAASESHSNTTTASVATTANSHQDGQIPAPEAPHEDGAKGFVGSQVGDFEALVKRYVVEKLQRQKRKEAQAAEAAKASKAALQERAERRKAAIQARRDAQKGFVSTMDDPDEMFEFTQQTANVQSCVGGRQTVKMSSCCILVGPQHEEMQAIHNNRRNPVPPKPAPPPRQQFPPSRTKGSSCGVGVDDEKGRHPLDGGGAKISSQHRSRYAVSSTPQNQYPVSYLALASRPSTGKTPAAISSKDGTVVVVSPSSPIEGGQLPDDYQRAEELVFSQLSEKNITGAGQNPATSKRYPQYEILIDDSARQGWDECAVVENSKKYKELRPWETKEGDDIAKLSHIQEKAVKTVEEREKRRRDVASAASRLHSAPGARQTPLAHVLPSEPLATSRLSPPEEAEIPLEAKERVEDEVVHTLHQAAMDPDEMDFQSTKPVPPSTTTQTAGQKERKGEEKHATAIVKNVLPTLERAWSARQHHQHTERQSPALASSKFNAGAIRQIHSARATIPSSAPRPPLPTSNSARNSPQRTTAGETHSPEELNTRMSAPPAERMKRLWSGGIVPSVPTTPVVVGRGSDTVNRALSQYEPLASQPGSNLTTANLAKVTIEPSPLVPYVSERDATRGFRYPTPPSSNADSIRNRNEIGPKQLVIGGTFRIKSASAARLPPSVRKTWGKYNGHNPTQSANENPEDEEADPHAVAPSAPQEGSGGTRTMHKGALYHKVRTNMKQARASSAVSSLHRQKQQRALQAKHSARLEASAKDLFQ